MDTLLRPYGTAELQGSGDPPFPLTEGKPSLDAMRVPYAAADLTVPLATMLTDPDDFDPRDGERITIEAGDAQAGTSRTFDLAIRSRVVDHTKQTIRLRLGSDETLLMDYASLTVDTGPRAHEASLRAVCDYVLDKIGASLEAGSVDADVTAYWPLTNLLTNPSVVGSSAGYFTGAAGTTIAYNSGAGFVGNGFLRCSQTSATGACFLAPSNTGGFPVQPGRTYAIASYLRVSTSTSTFTMTLRWLDENNGIIANAAGTGTSVNTSWTRVSNIATAPPGAVKCVPYLATTTSANGRTWDIDASIAAEDDELPDYFSGATSAGGGYTYAWAGDANASQSTRTPVVDRPRELFEWTPGTTAWEFLEPLTVTAGLRLFCTEAREWHLIDPAVYALPGAVTIAGWNSTEATDEITRDDADLWCTGVVCIYTWTDRYGIERTAYDTAGTPEKVYVARFDSPYPGPGSAAGILARRTGQGRVQDVTALANWAATPGMQCTIGLPDTPETIGRLTAIEWDLATGLMRVGSGGLLDIIPGSIDALIGTIDALTGTIDALA